MNNTSKQKKTLLNFDGERTKIIFASFLTFLNTLNLNLEVTVKNNKAFFSKPGEPSLFCVYPFRDELLYFEYSTNPFKEFDSKSIIPVQVSKPYDLELVKPITKLILSLPSSFNQKPILSKSETSQTQDLPKKSINKFFKTK